MQLLLVVEVEGAEFVAYRADGLEHSRWSVLAVDPVDELARWEGPQTTQVPRPPVWSLSTLDAALERQGYRRLQDWSAGRAGPVCRVTSSQL